MAKAAAPSKTHPSPQRGAVRPSSLFFALMAPPLAWITGQIVCSALAQEACFRKTQPLATPAFDQVRLFQVAVLVLGLLISAGAATVAFRAWRSTQQERGGGQHTLIEVGEGRSRFMAFAGLLTSVGFMTATLFSVLAVALVPAC